MYGRRFALCTSLLATAACAAKKPPSEDSIPANALALEVENHNWSDVVIYILHDGTRSRFTEVTAAKSQTREIPPQFISSNGTLQVIVHRIGGHDDTYMAIGGPRFQTAPDDYLSPVVSVKNGYTVSLTLEDDLQHSSIGIW